MVGPKFRSWKRKETRGGINLRGKRRLQLLESRNLCKP